MNFSQPKSYMYVKNEFNKCKDSESRAQWEKTGVHVFFHCRDAENRDAENRDAENRDAENRGAENRDAENRGGIEIGWSSEGHFVLWKLICYFASNIKR